ncbi:MAG TPA: PBP1A family penicillin-binding protein [Bacteroidetes bacterium]|nr:PBP1A family penicillin-binding protein [Bacteroidota bacterium]
MKRRIRLSRGKNFAPQGFEWTWKHTLAVAVVFALILAGLLFFWITRDLPSLTQLEHFEPRLVTKVFSADSVLIKEFYTQRRDYVPLREIPEQMRWAIIDIEDKRFYSHWGLDLKRIAKAILVDVTHLARLQGASTLTQQLARDLYFTKKKAFIRKFREIITAIQIERTYSKPEILEMYLNHIYFGHGAYGIKAAAEYFFNKNVKDLTLPECALLAAIVNVPAYYSPINHPDRAIKRRNLVLYLMYKNGHITKEQYEAAKAEPLKLGEGGRPGQKNIAPYFTEYVRQKLEDRFGTDLYTAGYRIYTTLDTRVQACAERAAKEQLARLQKLVNRRFQKPEEFQKLLDKYVPDPAEQQKILADPAKKDSLINARAAVQVAFVALDPHNGHILAMIGGRNFEESKFNRAVQAKRQPGSAFKPFIYTAVIDNGYPPTTEILNQPVVLFLPDGTRWIPRNFDRDQGGPTTLREALRRSLNLVSARILQEIVKPSVVVEYAHRMGITTNLRPVDALALGTSEVIPLELTAAYGVFANQGIWVKPIAITKVLNRRGEVIYEEVPEQKEVLSAQTAYIMTDMLETVVNRGTGVYARTIYHFTRPAGGKTGTTDNYTDAWFVGFTPQIAAGVWVGLDDPSISLGHNQTGSVAALPIWAKFMKAAHDTLQLPVEDFKMPPGVVRLLICKESKKLATEYCPEVYEEVFREDTAPKEYCPIHTGAIREKKSKKRRIIF